MAKVLIPFAEPEGAQRAVDALLREPPDPALTVHLVAVVEPLRPGKVAMFVTAERAESLVREAAQRWLEPVAAQLAVAGIAFTTETVVGPPKATITALTQRPDIDRVLLPPPRIGWLWRHDGEQIRDLSPHPVTLVA
jgi:nucleotide-binding universal stress UspA family protein